MKEKKLMTIYVTKEQYDEIIEMYGDEILPPDEILNGTPTSRANKRSPIGLNFTIKRA